MLPVEPAFTVKGVGRLFGVMEGTCHWAVRDKWITAGLLEAVNDAQNGDAQRRVLRIAPRAVLAFVLAHPDAYDWRKITDPGLRGVAERVEKRDPLVPLDEAIAGGGITKADVLRLAREGAPGVVVRIVGVQVREYFIRRSALSRLKDTLERERRQSDPLAALHALIDAETRQPSAIAVTRTSVDGHAVTVTRPVALPAAPGKPLVSEELRRCPACGSRRALGRLEDGPGWVLECMTGCGRSEVIADPEALARDEAERAAIRTEHRGPGRPPKARADVVAS